MAMKDYIHRFNVTKKEERQELIKMIDDLLEIEKNWNKVILVLKVDYAKDFVMVTKRLEQLNNIAVQAKTKQELVTKFSKEGDECQKRLDQIDLWAMEIQKLVKKIRANI